MSTLTSAEELLDAPTTDDDSDPNSRTEVVWVNSVRGLWGMGHSFENKLNFTRDIPEGKWVPKDLLAPAKPPMHPMLNSFVLCCNFCACKCACTVVVRSPRGGGGGLSLGDRPPRGGGGPSSLGWGTTRGGGGTKSAKPPPKAFQWKGVCVFWSSRSSGAPARNFAPSRSRSRSQRFERILCCILSFYAAIPVPENAHVHW